MHCVSWYLAKNLLNNSSFKAVATEYDYISLAATIIWYRLSTSKLDTQKSKKTFNNVKNFITISVVYLLVRDLFHNSYTAFKDSPQKSPQFSRVY